MSVKSTTARTRKPDVPYDRGSKSGTEKFWSEAVPHKGVAELRAKRGRPGKAAEDRKEQIALRVDRGVLEWYRAQGAGWQTRMNAVLGAFRDVCRKNLADTSVQNSSVEGSGGGTNRVLRRE